MAEYKLTADRYFEALKEDKLLGLKCNDCGKYTVPPKIVCQECSGSNIEVVEMKGEGVIKTYTVVRVPQEGQESQAPIPIALVTLDEGPCIMGRISNIAPDELSLDVIGRRVEVGHMVIPGDKYAHRDGVIPAFTVQ